MIDSLECKIDAGIKIGISFTIVIEDNNFIEIFFDFF